jgi:hypothetical protein
MDIEHWPQMTNSIAQVRRIGSGPNGQAAQSSSKQPRLPRVRRKVAERQPGRSLSGKPPSGGATAGGHTVERHASVAMITFTLRQVRPLARLAQALLGRRIHRYLSMELDGFRRTASMPR